MIGIYGGAFDPFHLGHVSAIKNSLKSNNISQVIVVPSYYHAYGKEMAPFDLRIKWIQAVISNKYSHTLPVLEQKNIFVSDIEKQISENKEGPVYTIDVLRAIKELLKRDLAFITGADNDITAYKGYDDIKSEFDIITVPEDIQFMHSSELKRNMKKEILLTNVPESIVDSVYEYYINQENA